MDALQLKPRQPAADNLEDWDDDDFMIDADDLTFRSGSTSVQALSHRRDSQSSHFSVRSEFESIHGEDERHVHLPGDDPKSTLDAIAAAAKAGIPLPQNVPPSALVGGTIKRLGGRHHKKMVQEDDWGDELELPEVGQSLQIKKRDSSQFPDILRHVSSSTQPSPAKPPRVSGGADLQASVAQTPVNLASAANLERFQDMEEDDSFFSNAVATIKASKTYQHIKPVSLITPPTPQKKAGDDDFEIDFELPFDGKLTLSHRKDIPRTPALNTLDDFEWGEGSLGTRHGGTRRDGRSNRSSSASALSPSIASSVTAESEDETFDGLVLPMGPVNFEERLKQRRQSRSPERQQPSKQTPQREVDKEDFAAGLDLGDGDVFSAKLTLHRNVKIKETRPASPARPKAAVSLTFSSKPAPLAPTVSRLPRPMVSHERSLTQSSLEPVSESGGPIVSRLRRPQSRLGGHSAQSSVSSIPTPTTPSSSQSLPPSTPQRREVGQKISAVSLRGEPTTTSAQLLRLKRSLPAMRPPQSPARPYTGRAPDRPPSRTDVAARPTSYIRPKTPPDRIRNGAESAQGRRNPVPFLPAGASVGQSHNINARSSRTFRRHDSENSLDGRPSSRAMSRSTMRSPSPSKRNRNNLDKLAQEGASQYISKPRRQRNFGDGHELDGFDDLPTSSQAEAKFVRQPITTGSKVQLRSRVYQNILPDRTNTPSPYPPRTPSRLDYQPRFARDTAASRIARETSLAQRGPPAGPLAPLTMQRVTQLSTRGNLNMPLPLHPVRPKRSSKKQQQLKPHLIANLNSSKDSKVVNGMMYNPETFRWEGNENALNAFDVPISSPSTASAAHVVREKENATPRPALITPIGATKGPQIVGSMVFDAQNMCWVKLGRASNVTEDDFMDGFDALEDEDDDDVFRDIPDLEDHTIDSAEGAHGRVSDIKDEWLVGEEFDVGPEFVRRQREEEERWRKKLEKWKQPGIQRNREAERWRIREILLGDL